ncbi:L-ascorbate peroxidase, cytosolic [Apostasia shenzhenica]|uniref:L-ascorbate peroxidase, cytosolic n=1 Tax=Apostasia shenzhenica TaxID=1088818 RepID=A0A2I0B1W9_9ASPA|nr:L-ascorbate peroxidase, cytosolic [Apostasia shenzhenica]
MQNAACCCPFFPATRPFAVRRAVAVHRAHPLNSSPNHASLGIHSDADASRLASNDTRSEVGSSEQSIRYSMLLVIQAIALQACSVVRNSITLQLIENKFRMSFSSSDRPSMFARGATPWPLLYDVRMYDCAGQFWSLLFVSVSSASAVWGDTPHIVYGSSLDVPDGTRLGRSMWLLRPAGPFGTMKLAEELAHSANNGLDIAVRAAGADQGTVSDSFFDSWLIVYSFFRSWLVLSLWRLPAAAGLRFLSIQEGSVTSEISSTCLPFPDKNEPSVEGRLPDSTKGADHLRVVFSKQMGLSDQDIVALFRRPHTGQLTYFTVFP